MLKMRLNEQASERKRKGTEDLSHAPIFVAAFFSLFQFPMQAERSNGAQMELNWIKQHEMNDKQSIASPTMFDALRCSFNF